MMHYAYIESQSVVKCHREREKEREELITVDWVKIKQQSEYGHIFLQLFIITQDFTNTTLKGDVSLNFIFKFSQYDFFSFALFCMAAVVSFVPNIIFPSFQLRQSFYYVSNRVKEVLTVLLFSCL